MNEENSKQTLYLSKTISKCHDVRFMTHFTFECSTFKKDIQHQQETKSKNFKIKNFKSLL